MDSKIEPATGDLGNAVALHVPSDVPLASQVEVFVALATDKVAISSAGGQVVASIGPERVLCQMAQV